MKYIPLLTFTLAFASSLFSAPEAHTYQLQSDLAYSDEDPAYATAWVFHNSTDYRGDPDMIKLGHPVTLKFIKRTLTGEGGWALVQTVQPNRSILPHRNPQSPNYGLPQKTRTIPHANALPRNIP